MLSDRVFQSILPLYVIGSFVHTRRFLLVVSGADFLVSNHSLCL